MYELPEGGGGGQAHNNYASSALWCPWMACGSLTAQSHQTLFPPLGETNYYHVQLEQSLNKYQGQLVLECSYLSIIIMLGNHCTCTATMATSHGSASQGVHNNIQWSCYCKRICWYLDQFDLCTLQWLVFAHPSMTHLLDNLPWKQEALKIDNCELVYRLCILWFLPISMHALGTTAG